MWVENHRIIFALVLSLSLSHAYRNTNTYVDAHHFLPFCLFRAGTANRLSDTMVVEFLRPFLGDPLSRPHALHTLRLFGNYLQGICLVPLVEKLSCLHSLSVSGVYTPPHTLCFRLRAHSNSPLSLLLSSSVWYLLRGHHRGESCKGLGRPSCSQPSGPILESALPQPVKWGEAFCFLPLPSSELVV